MHPAQTTITGNAGTATALQTGRTIAITGDLIYTSPAFNGSANVTAVGTLANSGVTAGTYNNSATTNTPLIVDAKGRITGTGAAVTITPAWSSITSKPTTVAGYGISDVYTTTNTYSKSEVDSLVQGFRGKASATVATTTALTFNTAQIMIDGVTISSTDRVLIKNQANAAQNGIYTNVTTTAWVRAGNADTAEELTSALVFIDKGTANIDTAWLQTTDDIVLETSNLNWIQFANSGSYAPLVHTHSAADITSGILPVARGGTGVSTISGLVKGNGTGAMTAAVAGTDYVLPGGSITGNAATATKLAVVRTINGTSFDGTADITITDDTKQPVDGDLTSIAGLAGTTGLLRKNAANSWSLDTTAYLSNIGITLPLTSTGGANPTLGINAVTTSANGIMIASDKIKLDSIAANANNYSLPNSTSLVVGGVKLFSDTVQAVVSNAVTATANRTYGVQVNSLGQLVVNVPWVDIAANSYSKSEVDSLVQGFTYDKATIDALVGNSSLNGAYGVTWNNETNLYKRIGNDFTQIQKLMKRCVLNFDGTVRYFLDPNDSTKKEDGALADLTGASGNVMVQIPKFYYKHIAKNNDMTWLVSLVPQDGFEVHPAFKRGNIEVDFRYYRAYTGYVSGGKLLSRSGVNATGSLTISQFRTYAMANGSGWSLTDWNLLHAIQVLFLTEYATFNSQSVLGNGNHTGGDNGMVTGQSNIIGNGSSGVLNSDKWMSYRGIENFYADIWEFIDGINIQNYIPFVNNNLPSTYISDVFTGDYVNTGVTMIAGASATFVKKVSKEFFPTVAGGDSNSFLTDGFWSNTGNRIVLFGGSAYNGLSDGAFCLRVEYAASDASALVGAGIAF